MDYILLSGHGSVYGGVCGGIFPRAGTADEPVVGNDVIAKNTICYAALMSCPALFVPECFPGAVGVIFIALGL